MLLSGKHRPVQFRFQIVTCLSLGKGLGARSLASSGLVGLQRAPCSGSFWLVMFLPISLCTSYLGSESKPGRVRDGSLLGLAQSNQGGWLAPRSVRESRGPARVGTNSGIET